MDKIVRKTKSGIYIREDAGFGLITFSPYTGLIYAIHPSQSSLVTKWLDNSNIQLPSDIYKLSLGAGWALRFEDSKFPYPHLLPEEEFWSNIPRPRYPILINWLITGKCPLACLYCYAEDMMRQMDREPKGESAIKRIAESILELNPLAVVLTGGDPLFSPHLAYAIQILDGKTGIIVDTNGYTFSQEHLNLLKKHNIAVRISLDFERPKQNQAVRKFDKEHPILARVKSTGRAALDALCLCLDAGIAVTVQTVATKLNVNDLVSFGDKLYRMGVTSWRIFVVSDSKVRHEEYLRLLGNPKSYSYMWEKIYKAYISNWQQSMAVQFILHSPPNAVILVGPDGKFYNESITRTGKTLIDELNPTKPSSRALDNWLGWESHVKRYLNMID
ncbi:MAG: pqqE [Anaerolineaceae bacterium]|nr:MAG: pqqE [Anaerolineaceae bacterium]